MSIPEDRMPENSCEGDHGVPDGFTFLFRFDAAECEPARGARNDGLWLDTLTFYRDPRLQQFSRINNMRRLCRRSGLYLDGAWCA